MDPHLFTCLWTHSSRPVSVLPPTPPPPSGEIFPWASLRHTLVQDPFICQDFPPAILQMRTGRWIGE